MHEVVIIITIIRKRNWNKIKQNNFSQFFLYRILQNNASYINVIRKKDTKCKRVKKVRVVSHKNKLVCVWNKVLKHH